MNPSIPRVWIAGATGLIGRELLALALLEAREVHVLLRRPAPELGSDDKLKRHQVNFQTAASSLQECLPKADALFICLGTTIKAAGSQEAFKALDLEAVLKVARAARAAGIARCAVVSALGAKADSAVFYTRVKGEMEAGLKALQFERLLIVRPSLLSGDRARLGQARRAGEIWAERLSRPLGALIPARWRPVEAGTVALALWRGLQASEPALEVLESEQLQALQQARQQQAAAPLPRRGPPPC